MASSSQKVTIFQVADEAGVAISTVSKVISNKKGVSEDTRRKVQDAIARLGYIPNLAARSLSGGDTRIIGLLVPYSAERLFSDPYLVGNILGIEKALIERDYSLLLSVAREEVNLVDTYDRLLHSRYFDGLIIMETGSAEKNTLLQRLQKQERPWVIMGYPAGIGPCYAVYADDHTGGQMAAEHLLSLGHRRIAIIHSDPSPSALIERIRGFELVLHMHGLEMDKNNIFYGDLTHESGYKIAPHILSANPPPTAIFALNDRMAQGVMRWAQEHAIKIPQDLSIIGFDDILDSADAHPPLTTIRQPAIETGREAVRQLFCLLDGTFTPIHIVLGTELVVRASTGPARGQ